MFKISYFPGISMQRIYCLSGLGADQRIFSRLKLPGYELRHISWIQPRKKESLIDYAQRLAENIEDDRPILLGLSFGGMVCLEMTRFLKPAAVILISSVERRSEIPIWMRACGRLGVERFLPSRQFSSIPALRMLRPVQNYFLGAKTAQEKAIANQYRDSVDPEYLRWSIGQVFRWQNKQVPENLYHIHGDADHIFPLGKLKPTHIIKGGGHFMVLNRHEEISRILAEILARQETIRR